MPLQFDKRQYCFSAYEFLLAKKFINDVHGILNFLDSKKPFCFFPTETLTNFWNCELHFSYLILSP